MGVQSKRRDQDPWEPGGQEEEEDEDGESAPAYLGQATELITRALRDEKAGAYAAALQGYQDGVHILLQGVSGGLSSKEQGKVENKGPGELVQLVKRMPCQQEDLN